MALTKLRIGKQLAASASARSILITDSASEPAYFAPTTGADTILFWDDSASNWAQLTLGTNLSITGTTINASAGAGGYAEVQEEGSALTARTKINFVGSAATAADDAGNTRTNVTFATILNTIATDGAVDLTDSVTGTLPVANGGTGAATLTGILQGNGTSAVTAITNSSTVGQVLRVTGASTYAWGALDLADADAVTGVLGVSNGGTSFSSYTTGDLIYASGSNSLAKRGIGGTGTFLRSNGTVPAWQSAAAADLSDGASLAHIDAIETISAVWTFSTLPESAVTPTTSNQLTNKSYVDSLIANQRKLSVRAATTANGTLATAYENGDTIDGVTLATGNRILLKNQTTQSENGIYTVNSSGAPTRATDMDTAGEVDGTFVVVEDGTTLAGTLWLTVSEVTTLGTDAIVFTQVNKATDLIDGDGLVATGLTWNVVGTSGRIVANANSIDLATTAVTPATYGSPTQVGTFTVDAYGRLTAAANTAIVITASAVSDFREQVEDYVGTMLTDSSTIDFTYTDNGASPGTFTAIVIDDSITYAKIQNVTDARLLGRSAGSNGDVQELTVGAGLTLSGGSLVHADTSSVANVDTSGAQIIDTITFDTYGHVTAIATRNLALDDVSDVTITGVSSGEVLSWNGSAWVNSTSSGTVTEAYADSFTGSSISLNSGSAVTDVAGTNIAFTTPSNTAKLAIYRNGLRLRSSDSDGTPARDYTVNTGTHVVTFTESVVSGETLYFIKLS